MVWKALLLLCAELVLVLARRGNEAEDCSTCEDPTGVCSISTTLLCRDALSLKEPNSRSLSPSD